MDGGSDLASFITSTLPKLSELDLEDLNYIQESDLLHVLKPVEVRRQLSHFRTTRSSPLAAAHFMLYVDQTIVSSQITGFSDAVVLLFTSYYCLNISYPSSPRSNIGVLAKISASPTM
ncbi:uncharacterized protein LOC115567474 isoform X2 [Sparus aurata]|uniref:uncharacterized protein LOC115567474 isoform X2 n=1 Tax=Sparus aurata TaxID=8175 RepID=UPI0011C16223|nr:uncharacterized protein LOC115567474 isoform X2 [Sparus aurata]